MVPISLTRNENSTSTVFNLNQSNSLSHSSNSTNYYIIVEKNQIVFNTLYKINKLTRVLFLLNIINQIKTIKRYFISVSHTKTILSQDYNNDDGSI